MVNQAVDGPIWRYIDLSKFLHLVSSQTLYFPRADKLDDPFEGTISRSGHEAFIRRIQEAAADQGGKKPRTAFLKYNDEWIVFANRPDDMRLVLPKVLGWFRTCTYVSCWHANPHESEAMWRLYSNNIHDCVALKTTATKLRSGLSLSVDYSPITYVDYQSDYSFPDYFSSPFRTKRIAFAHEREVRFIVQDPPYGDAIDGFRSFDTTSNRSQTGIYGKLLPDLSDCIDEIRLSPFACEWLYDCVGAVLEKFQVEVPLRRSDLQIEPFKSEL